VRGAQARDYDATTEASGPLKRAAERTPGTVRERPPAMIPIPSQKFCAAADAQRAIGVRPPKTAPETARSPNRKCACTVPMETCLYDEIRATTDAFTTISTGPTPTRQAPIMPPLFRRFVAISLNLRRWRFFC